MFKKLFGRKGSPTNEGNSGPTSKVDKVRWVKKFTLELSNMEGSPSYTLSHQLTVGSEVGNIVIADPSVSPRHCTFILQEEVVSVLDHGSVAGTLINGKKIPPGRYIILEESDTIMAGDLEIKIQVQNEAHREAIEEDEADELLEDEESLEAAPEEEPEEPVAEEEIEEETEEEEEPVEKKPSLFQRLFKKKNKPAPAAAAPKKKKQNDLSFTGHSHYATNSIVRLFAVIGDVLIAYSLYIIFSPFDEFRAFVNDVPVMLGQLLDIDWGGLWTILNEEYGFLGEMVKDLYSFLSSTFQVGPFFLLFIIVRMVSTLLFGVSISEAMLGVRSHGNAVWKRLGGLIRVIIGIFTGPFLIFDVPAVISRRTFKEFMTFTHTYLSSKFVAILGVILYVPLLVGMALLSPLLQGLELPEPVLVNEKLDKRIKVASPTEAAPVEKRKDQSKFLNMELEFDPQTISLIPQFKFSGQEKKLKYKPSLVFYHKDLQRSVQLELFKTFDLKELLGIGMKGNFFLYEKFPEIYNFVYSAEGANPVFKGQNTEQANRKFADEFVSYTKVAFELDANNAFEIMQAYTPLLKGMMDYRSAFMGLIEYKEFDQISFFKLGNAYFLKISYLRQRPFDLIIPLIKGEGRIFKVEFDKKENLGSLSNKFYKFTLDGTNWFPSFETTEAETLKPLEVLDFFSMLNLKEDKIGPEKAQALYGYYFEKSAEVMRQDDPIQYEIWKKSVDSIFTIMEKMKDSIPATIPEATPDATVETTPEVAPEAAPEAATAPETVPEVLPESLPEPAPVVEEDPRMKLYQNFQDLKDAVENKNKEYFGIEEGVSI